MAETRYPAVAGAFYPDDKKELMTNVSDLLENADSGSNKCVISPHAGYMYSGRTAASAIKSLKNAKTFIILGPNHTGMGAQFAVMCEGVWKTPLGDVKIDEEIALRLEKAGVVDDDEIAHLNEHSVEVQLPFLQKTFDDFRIVPISILNIGYSSDLPERCVRLGKEIAEIASQRDVGIIASSDFSHYISLEEAKVKDDKAIEAIKTLNVKKFFAVLETMDASVCGYGPIAAVMQAAKELGAKDVEVLHESSSGDLLKDYKTVVTYKAIGFR
ncbi:MAG: AmmeMemoRadiSam system protein B [Candidatus Micrarchaeota archaeon]|nr:AmmeMemoRadiSam system protein B [Candidatus Micrarchaeota archaeon]